MYEHATRVNIDDHEMQLNTIFFNDSLKEPWLFYYGRIPYGYSAPYVQKQTSLWVGQNGSVIGGHNYAHIIGEMYFWELL